MHNNYKRDKSDRSRRSRSGPVILSNTQFIISHLYEFMNFYTKLIILYTRLIYIYIPRLTFIISYIRISILFYQINDKYTIN